MWPSCQSVSQFFKSQYFKFVADAASVRLQTPAIRHADAGSVGHDPANLEGLSLSTSNAAAT